MKQIGNLTLLQSDLISSVFDFTQRRKENTRKGATGTLRLLRPFSIKKLRAPQCPPWFFLFKKIQERGGRKEDAESAAKYRISSRLPIFPAMAVLYSCITPCNSVSSVVHQKTLRPSASSAVFICISLRSLRLLCVRRATVFISIFII